MLSTRSLSPPRGSSGERLLWVRCGENSCPAEHRLEQVLRVSDLLLESGGFGLIALDLGDLPEPAARRIPLTTWFRFRRAVEHTPTVLLTVERQPIAGSCSSLLIRLGSTKMGAPENRVSEPSIDSEFPAPSHAQLLTELKITAEMVRSRLDRKPVRSAEIRFRQQNRLGGMNTRANVIPEFSLGK